MVMKALQCKYIGSGLTHRVQCEVLPQLHSWQPKNLLVVLLLTSMRSLCRCWPNISFMQTGFFFCLCFAVGLCLPSDPGVFPSAANVFLGFVMIHFFRKRLFLCNHYHFCLHNRLSQSTMLLCNDPILSKPQCCKSLEYFFRKIWENQATRYEHTSFGSKCGLCHGPLDRILSWLGRMPGTMEEYNVSVTQVKWLSRESVRP